MPQEARAASINYINSPENLGWIKIDSLIITKALVLQKLRIDPFIDDTILKIRIYNQLFPGEQPLISMKFMTKIRKYNPAGGKGGYKKNLYSESVVS